MHAHWRCRRGITATRLGQGGGHIDLAPVGAVLIGDMGENYGPVPWSITAGATESVGAVWYAAAAAEPDVIEREPP